MQSQNNGLMDEKKDLCIEGKFVEVSYQKRSGAL